MCQKISRLLAALALFLAVFTGSVQASWTYTTGSTGTQNGFTYSTTITENPANTFTGTATLTAFSGSSAAIPSTVPIRITVNTTNSQGQPYQYYEWVNCTVKGFSGFTLNSDASFSGNVNIIGSFNLNGNDLSVNGNIIHQSGSLTFGTLPVGSTDTDIHLEISGDYLQARDADGNGSYESYCAGTLTMNNSADRMVVGGNAQFWTYTYAYGGSTFSAGILEIKGNFLAKVDASSIYQGYQSFPANGTHRTLLSGTNSQNVTLEKLGGGYFNILEVTNPNGVLFTTDVRYNSLFAVGVTLQVGSGGSVEGPLSSNVEFSGNIRINGSVDLKGFNLTSTGDVIHQAGILQLSGGRLEISGSYLQQRDADGNGSYETCSSGYLYMNNPADYMLVVGRVQFWNSAGSGIGAGTLEVKGDFSQKTLPGSASVYTASEAHRTLLSGTGTQTVSFESPSNSYFGILEVTNPNPLIFGSIVRTSRVKSPTVLTIQSPSGGGICGTLECDINYTASAFTILTTMNLAGHAVTVNCPVRQIGSLNLAGGSFTITGTGGWNQMTSLTVGVGGQLKMPGNYNHQSGSLNLNGGRLEIGGDYLQARDADGNGSYESYCNGYLTMNNSADRMVVGGNAQFWTYSNSYGGSTFSAGILEIKGNFLAKVDASSIYQGYQSFPANGTHRTLLSGTNSQNVTLEKLGGGYFNILEVTNPNPISLLTSAQVSKFIATSSTINASGSGNTLILASSPTEFSISGNTVLSCAVSGSYGLTKTGLGTLALNAANTYTGTTSVNQGTLGGNGTVVGPLVVASGATLSPGLTSISTFGVNNTLSLSAGSITSMQISKVGGVASGDRITGLTGVTYGGTLRVSLVDGTPGIGDKFVLFSKTSGSYSGWFTSLQLPTLPPECRWSTKDLLVDGSIIVADITTSDILFADTFNRTNNTNLNAASIGKSGVLGALSWTERAVDSTGVTVDVSSNALHMNDGTPVEEADGSAVWLDRNFTGLKEFTVRVDISSASSTGENRELGIGIGQTVAELNAMTGASGTRSPADIYVGYDSVGTTTGIRVWENGTDIGYVSTGGLSVPDTLSVKYSFANTNAGTPISYKIYLNGIEVVTRSAVWSGTNENYISLQTNYTSDVLFDNFEISGIAAPPNRAPTWSHSSFSKTVATEGTTYMNTLAGEASDADNDTLTYALVSAPTWLSVASNGTLSGTPGHGDAGDHVFTVSVSDGRAALVAATLNIKVQTAFDVWASGLLTFAGDSNRDGVADGMAWLLGANNPSENAHAMLSPAAVSNGDLKVSFRCLKADKRGSAVLRLQYSKDLGITDLWSTHTVAIPPASATVDGVGFVITAVEGSDLDDVQATVPASAKGGGGEIFMRLSGEIATP